MDGDTSGRDELGTGGAGGINTVISYKFVPEAKGKRPEDIQEYFQVPVEQRKT